MCWFSTLHFFPTFLVEAYIIQFYFSFVFVTAETIKKCKGPRALWIFVFHGAAVPISSCLSKSLSYFSDGVYIREDTGTQRYPATARSWLVGSAYLMDLIRGPLDGRDMFGMVFPAALLATVSFCADCTIYPGYTISSLDGRLGGRCFASHSI
jgi:hypothetical protein